MISDVLHDALIALEECENTPMYSDENIRKRIATVKDAMRALMQELDDVQPTRRAG